ncbi:MAG: sulfite exporter TauE/SafE family protein [Betaproteobacteria bacterium]
MQSSLAVTAALMGLAGGPHCIAMCGAACAGLGRTGGTSNHQAMWLFQLGRILGYSALGAVAAASLQGLGWLTGQSAALGAVWSLFHLACVALGLSLLWQGRQPVWLEGTGRSIWRVARAWTQRGGAAAPLVMGVLWSLLPCGLLYSALLVAALSSRALEGAAVMALFAAGTSVSLMAGPWLWLRLRGAGRGDWGMRAAGLALAGSSAWALWMGLVHNTAPWCVTP